MSEPIELLKQGKYTEALDLFENNFIKDPYYDDTGHFQEPEKLKEFLTYATDIIEKQRTIRAEKEYDDTFEERVFELWWHLVDHHVVDYSEYELASECVMQLLQISDDILPDDAEDALLALTYTGRYFTSLEICKRVLTKYPNNGSEDIILERKIEALRGIGKYKESYEEIEKYGVENYLANNPESFVEELSYLNDDPKTFLEKTETSFNKLAKSNDTSDDAINIQRMEADRLCERAHAFNKLNKKQDAINSLEKSIELTRIPTMKAIRSYRLGYIYAEIGEKENAASLFKNALNVFDSDKRIKKAIDFITKNNDIQKITETDIEKNIV